MAKRNSLTAPAFTNPSTGRQTQQVGEAGFDNIRDNIDPHIKTKVLNTKEILADSIQFNLTPNITDHKEGRLYWNNDDKTLNIDTDVNDVKLQIGQEQFVRVVNKTSSTITNGTVVYIDGAQGNRPTINKADVSVLATSENTIGIVTSDIENNLNGYVTTGGLVRDLDTDSFSEGDVVYLSTTPGEFTTTNSSVKIGIIITSHPTEGVILVDVDIRKEIYGSKYQHDTSTLITINTIGVAERVGGFTIGTLKNMLNVSDHSIKVVNPGFYLITWQISFTSAAANQEIEGGVGIAGFFNTQATAHRKIGTGTDTGSMSGTCILNLSQNTEISLMVLNETSTNNITIEHANFTCAQIGG